MDDQHSSLSHRSAHQVWYAISIEIWNQENFLWLTVDLLLSSIFIQGEEPKLTIIFPVQSNIQTHNQIPRKWYKIKLYGISYEIWQFDVNQTENGFTAPKKGR